MCFYVNQFLSAKLGSFSEHLDFFKTLVYLKYELVPILINFERDSITIKFFMIELLRKKINFLLPAFFFFLAAGIILISINKSDIHLFINHFHTPFFDWFFFIMTNLGSGFFALVVIFILMLFRYRYAFYTALSFITSGFIVQVLKRTVFQDIARPLVYFQGSTNLYLIPGTEVNVLGSFPSGHATTAFALCFCLSVILTKSCGKRFDLLLFFIALLVAFSRVYLSQHFFADIYFGSFIGILTAMVFYKYIFHLEKKWMDKSLFNLSPKKT